MEVRASQFSHPKCVLASTVGKSMSVHKHMCTVHVNEKLGKYEMITVNIIFGIYDTCICQTLSKHYI